VMFAWQNSEHQNWKLPGLAVTPMEQVVNKVNFDLELSLFEQNEQIVGALNYATALFDQPTIERHIGYLHTVLQAMVADHQQRIREINILSPVERRLLLEMWHTTET
ncbi:hypothetical protein ID850_19815, partial [Xenorhabdus sp. Flor]|uniref:condensation domain-containing protein n=1 Tax=Xenorhabdus cabanillasii TaxID=351673 RepID=UPI0019B3D36D